MKLAFTLIVFGLVTGFNERKKQRRMKTLRLLLLLAGLSFTNAGACMKIPRDERSDETTGFPPTPPRQGSSIQGYSNGNRNSHHISRNGYYNITHQGNYPLRQEMSPAVDNRGNNRGYDTPFRQNSGATKRREKRMSSLEYSLDIYRRSFFLRADKKVIISRDNVFGDLKKYLQTDKSRKEFLTSNIYTSIAGEVLRFLLIVVILTILKVGKDDGGITREAFSLLSRELAENNRLFTQNDQYQLVIASNSSTPSDLRDFRFLGNLIALALIHRQLIAVSFPIVYYKILLGSDIGLDDLKDFDRTIYDHLQFIL